MGKYWLNPLEIRGRSQQWETDIPTDGPVRTVGPISILETFAYLVTYHLPGEEDQTT